MDAARALAALDGLKERGEFMPDEAMRLAESAAAAFLAYHAAAGGYLGEAIALLAEWATSADPALARAGIHGLFPCLIERLGDAFEPTACALYNRLFAQVIQHCRHLPAGAPIDRLLRRFGLLSEDDLLERAARVRATQDLPPDRRRLLRRIFVLSRVTIGADVAVTSVILAALKQVCPQARLTLMAAPKVQQLFAGDPGVGPCPLEYARGGGLLERLESWRRAVEVIQAEVATLRPWEYLIVDPDSRLTQLGLLPLVPDAAPYVFFESRSYRAGARQRIGELTAHWAHRLFGAALPLHPYCAPSPSDQAFARELVGAMRRRGAGPVVSLNLGVGANPRKRLSEAFERGLLERLLREGATVILDEGGEPEEAARGEALRLACAARGYGTAALDEGSATPHALASAQSVSLLTWHGGIGRFAALIAQSDLYVGYDSAGQHIAAALGVPTIDIFTGFSSPRMPQRWAPYGPGAVHMVVIDEAERESPTKLAAVVDEVLACVRQVRRR